MTDLLTRLLALAELAVDAALEYDYGDPEDRHIYRELQELKPLVQQALEQPEPEGPTDEELLEINDGAYFPGTDEVNDEDDSSWQYTSDYIRWLDENGTPEEQAAYTAKGLRAVFEAGRRWGRPAIEPVPVSERPILKSSNFNDANGHCWCGTSASVDETGDLSVEMPPSWELREPCAQDDCVLPHHALPVPTTRREENLDG